MPLDLGSAEPLVVGLSGGIASGKSRVGALLAARGARVLDADRIAHEELLRPEVRDEVVAALGPGALGADGAVDRRAVAGLVFGDRARLAALEAILHPRVLARIAAELEAARAAPGEPRRTVVLDAPLLAEAGGMGICAEVLYIEASATTRRARARERGWADGELERREARQLGLGEKRAAATYVLDNDGDLAATDAAVDRFWRERVLPRAAAG